MCEHKNIEQNINELEDVLEGQANITRDKEREICRLKKEIEIINKEKMELSKEDLVEQELVTGLTIENEDLRAHLTNSQILLKNMKSELRMANWQSRETNFFENSPVRLNTSSDDHRHGMRYQTLGSSVNVSHISYSDKPYYKY